MPRTKMIAMYGALAMMAAVTARTAAITSTRYMMAFMPITQAFSDYRRGDDAHWGELRLELLLWPH